jgi:hypothetical protein
MSDPMLIYAKLSFMAKFRLDELARPMVVEEGLYDASRVK